MPVEAHRLGGGILTHEASAEVADIFNGKITAVIVHRAVHEVVAILHHVGEDLAFLHVVFHRFVLLSLTVVIIADLAPVVNTFFKYSKKFF